jgi:hypothetical protein
METYELYDRDGVTYIRRNKYPRFIGKVTMGEMSVIEDMELLDDVDDIDKLSAAIRKAGEYLRKGWRSSAGIRRGI